MKVITFFLLTVILLSGITLHSQTIKDIEGNIYNIITIGNQVWMKENLKTTKYNDGTSIPLVTESIGWIQLTTPGYCWYNNDKSTYGETYGALYNWYTVHTGNLCPSGWHVPTYAEWGTLIDFLGGPIDAGNKLKETDTTHWTSPNSAATNESGFTALPGGARSDDGTFLTFGVNGCWWSSEMGQTTFLKVGFRILDFSRDYSLNYLMRGGSSVRCVKD